jgi:hypothetical protein
MVGDVLTQERHVGLEGEPLRSNSPTDLADDDGPEFSSEPMPAAYGLFYSAGLGLLMIAVLVAIFWR